MNKNYFESGRVNQKLDTRQKLLEAAKLLINKGQLNSLEDVARTSGISRATVYRYFSSIDLLAYEVGIDLGTQSPEALIENLKDLPLKDKLIAIQTYYNNHAINNEKAFRKYLSASLTSPATHKRGARRNQTLYLALKDTKIPREEKDNLVNLLSTLMGIEPLIVAKDVSGLNNDAFKKLLLWGLEIILKHYESTK